MQNPNKIDIMYCELVQLLYPPPSPPSIPVPSHCFWVLRTKLNALHMLRNCLSTGLNIQPGFLVEFETVLFDGSFNFHSMDLRLIKCFI